MNYSASSMRSECREDGCSSIGRVVIAEAIRRCVHKQDAYSAPSLRLQHT